MEDRIVKTQELQHMVAMKLDAIDKMIASGDFPADFKFGPTNRIRGWRLSEVQQWIRKQGKPEEQDENGHE